MWLRNGAGLRRERGGVMAWWGREREGGDGEGWDKCLEKEGKEVRKEGIQLWDG
jgi:hypothetical protein